MTGAVADGPAAKLVDGAAALALAAALGMTSWMLLAGSDLIPRVAAAAAGSVAGFAAALRVVRRIAGEAQFALPAFATPAIAPHVEVGDLWPEELVLTERYEPSEDELLLEDLLPRIDADSRVVRLFDPAAMPAAGELRGRIEQYRGSRSAAPDATEELVAALNALREAVRRSVR